MAMNAASLWHFNGHLILFMFNEHLSFTGGDPLPPPPPPAPAGPINVIPTLIASLISPKLGKFYQKFCLAEAAAARIEITLIKMQ